MSGDGRGAARFASRLAPARRSLARRLRALPVVLLLSIAGGQWALTARGDLSPWSGGGFGMFSTVDAGGARHLHAFQVRPGVEREVAVPRELAVRAATLPTGRFLRGVAEWVAAQPSSDHGPVGSVRIQVFRPRFDPETLAPSSELLREVEIAVGDG